MTSDQLELLEKLAGENDRLRQIALSAHARLDLLELQLACHVSHARRSKDAWQYAEEAVAAEFGITVGELYRKPGKPGRPKAGQLPPDRQAQFVLYSLLTGAMRLPATVIRDHYGEDVSHYSRQWGDIFRLVHRPQPADARGERLWKSYAPRYSAVYRRWKAAMQADDCWHDAYDDALFDNLDTTAAA